MAVVLAALGAFVYTRLGATLLDSTDQTLLAQATEAGGDYAAQCESALLTRRLWTIPMVAVGSIVLAVVVFVAATVWGRESVFGEDPAT